MLRKRQTESLHPSLENSVNPKEYNRIATGLLSADRVREELTAINRSNHFEKLTVPSETEEPWTVEDQEAYVREFAEDVIGLHIRLRRLKWQLSRIAHTGCYSSSTGKQGNKADQRDAIEESLEKCAQDLREFDYSVLNEDRLRVIREMSHYIPSNLLEGDVGHWTTEDVQLLRDLCISTHESYTFHPAQQQLARRLMGEIEKVEHRLRQMNEQAELFPTNKAGAIHEQTMQQCWSSYRRLVKETANCFELENWVSPTYRSSQGGNTGPEQDAIPFRTDYQRWFTPDIADVELRFHRAFFPNTNPDVAHSILFQSGMGALDAIMYLLKRPTSEKQENERKPSLFRVGIVYAEVSTVLKEYCTQQNITLRELKSLDTADIVTAIKTEMPMAVFLAPVANSAQMEIIEITKILEKLTDPVWAEEYKTKNSSPMMIAIDNTTLGILAKWKRFDMSRLPSCIRLLSYESLVKYAQDGQDIVQAGLVTAFDKRTVRELLHLRQQRGMMPTENTAHKLRAAIPPDMLSIKMRRHSRNTELFAQRLEEAIRIQPQGILESVILPHGVEYEDHSVQEQESEGMGGLFTLHISPTWVKKAWGIVKDAAIKIEDELALADQMAARYMLLIIFLAKRHGLSVNAGTSFGFQTTRLSVYYATDLYPYPYIRVASGTENKKDARLLAEVFVRANRYFEELIQPKNVAFFCDLICNDIPSA